jgi:hypothetical protein
LSSAARDVIVRRVPSISPPCSVASFRLDDPDALVRASLSCPSCLHAAATWRVAGAYPGEDEAVCRCSNCRESYRVFLMPEQVVRLSLVGLAPEAGR